MSKGIKLTALPKLAEWKAPWEVKKAEDGTTVDVPEDEQVIDKEQLKKYLYGLLNDKITIRNSLDETTATVEALEQQISEATDPKKIEDLQKEVADARKERDEAAKPNTNALKWEIALDKGLTKTQAKRLVGTTREELEADAEEILVEWGHQGTSGEGEGGEVRSAPKRRLNNGGDPDPDEPPKGKVKTPEEVAAEWLANR